MKGRKENGQFDLNNDFWKKRILHGNKTDYTPEQLLKAFFQYVKWNNENDFELKEKSNSTSSKDSKDTNKVKTLQRPLNREKFNAFLGKRNRYFQQLKSSKKTDFSNVIEWIENFIDSEQFEGAAAGIFNANIISRKLGLQDKSQTILDSSVKKARKRKKKKDRKF